MEPHKRASDCFDILAGLSKEMRGEILHWLAEDIYTIRALGKIATVCKTWSVYVADNFLWKQLYQHEWQWEDLSEVEARRISCGFNWKKMYLHRRQVELAKPPGEHITLEVAVTLVELYKGVTKRFAQKDLKSGCPKCGGYGAKKPSYSIMCEPCTGTGKIMKVNQVGGGMVQQVQTDCPQCNGSGRTCTPQNRCPDCQGEGFILKRSILKVDITAGMQWGDQILLEGRGEQKSYKEQPGDVILTLTEKTLDGLSVTRFQTDHILFEKEISFSESLFGYSFLYTQIDGRKIVIKSKPGVITTTGMIMTVEGEGMPIPASTARGNLLVKFKVADAKLTKDQIMMLQNLRPQLEAILGSPSYYQVSEGEDVITKEGKFAALATEGRKPKKVRPKKRPAPQQAAGNQQQNDIFNQFFPNGVGNQNHNDENMDVDDDANNNGNGGAQCKQQ